MPYNTAEARQRVLDILADATQEIGFALACLGEAYEQLDEAAGERLEEVLFAPVQAAYARARRTNAGFAARYALVVIPAPARAAGPPSGGARGFLDRAIQALARADHALSELQDSMAPIEVGDPELRSGLEEVRGLIGGLAARAREMVRTWGR